MMVQATGAIFSLIVRQVSGSHYAVTSDEPLNKLLSVRSVQYGASPLFGDVLESLGTHVFQDLVPGWWWTWPPAASGFTSRFVPVEAVPDPLKFRISLASPVVRLTNLPPDRFLGR